MHPFFSNGDGDFPIVKCRYGRKLFILLTSVIISASLSRKERVHREHLGSDKILEALEEKFKRWPEKGMLIKVGNGAQTRFWHDWWTGKDTLKNLFPRLFSLSNQKDKLIVDMGTWEEGK